MRAELECRCLGRQTALLVLAPVFVGLISLTGNPQMERWLNPCGQDGETAYSLTLAE